VGQEVVDDDVWKWLSRLLFLPEGAAHLPASVSVERCVAIDGGELKHPCILQPQLLKPSNDGPSLAARKEAFRKRTGGLRIGRRTAHLALDRSMAVPHRATKAPGVTPK